MILEKAHTEYFQCRIPGILCSGSGSMFAYYECRGSSSDWAQIDLKIQKSVDDGKNWRTVKWIPGDGNTLNNPVMFVNGRTLHFLYCMNYKRVFAMKSLDDGETWTEAVELTSVYEESKLTYTVLALGPGHGITTKDSTMVIPTWLAYNEADPHAHKPSYICTFYSKDDGRSWHLGERIPCDFLVNPSECALGILQNGRVLISIRNENECRYRCFAVSDNGYEGWGQVAFDERFPDPICMGSLANGDGWICHVNCDSQKGRKNLVIRASRDDFRTLKSIPVDTCGGYADLCVKEDKAYVLYEETILNEEKWDINLHFQVVDLV